MWNKIWIGSNICHGIGHRVRQTCQYLYFRGNYGIVKINCSIKGIFERHLVLFQTMHAVVCDIAHIYLKMSCNIRNIENGRLSTIVNLIKTTKTLVWNVIRFKNFQCIGMSAYGTFNLLEKWRGEVSYYM